MERTCEFCAALRPIVYCMPDAAHLCLSCDAKVHSANALSSRHLRTLLCDLCRTLPTYLQCLDHQMFLCRGCDRSLHVSSSQHQKRTIRGYMGCPSARDFAALWGFHINEVDNVIQDKFVSTYGSETASDTTFEALGQACSQLTGVARMSYPPHVSGAEAENKGGSLTNETKVLFKGHVQSTSFIFQQILDLSRLQLIKNNHSPLILGEGKNAVSSLRPRASEKFEQSLNQHLQHSEDRGTDLPQRDSLLHELKTTPFSQLENFPLSSAVLLPFHGEPLWHCKSPAESNQLWSQNMQDLGVCDELVCGDDFNMPEVDLTFQNFEDMFDGDQDPIRGLLDSKDESYSSMEKDLSLDKSGNRHGKRMEASSVMSSSYIFRSAHMLDKDTDPSYQVCKSPTSTSTDSARPIQPSSSTLSFSDSRMSVGSAGSECPDGAGGEPSCSSPCRREQNYSMSHNSAAMKGHKEKKQPQLQERQIRRKPRSLVKKRVKGRYEKVERYDSDAIAISRSY